ncbi:MAG: nuclear transport factor 2 family protein [Deltaproteobacteria bacterium]|nr:nuclear transport factor 2 family protein [Deltaproteobacteria bacterium]
MSTEHPARAASQQSMELVTKKPPNAKERWLALFADDAIIEDPIGPSPLDPEGKGHRGKAALAAFWDMNIGPNELRFDIERSYACGNEVANVGTITTKTPMGITVSVPGVFTYRINDAGQLVALRAYWEFDTVMGALGAV